MKRLPYLAGIGFASIFGFSFMFSKIALNHLTIMQLLAFRFGIAFILFQTLVFLKVVKVDLKGKSLKLLLATALFQPILYFVTETIGINLSQSNEAGLMIALIPIAVAVFSSLILKEHPSKRQVLFILLSISGVMFINIMKLSSDVSINMLGILFLLGAVISAALYNIYSRKASKVFKPMEVTYFMMLVGAITFNVFALIESISSGNGINYLNFNQEVIWPLIYLGVLSSVLAFFLINYTLSKLTAHESSVFANLVTVISIFAGTFILGESFEYYHIIGSILIIIGVYGVVKKENRV